MDVTKNETVIIMCVYVLSLFSRVQLFATLWTVTCQAPLSMGFSRQEYWTFLTQGLNPGLLHHRLILCCLNHQDMATHLEIITKIKATFTIYNNTL